MLPSCFRLRTIPSLALSFVRFSSVLTTQPSALSFPFFPLSPDGGSRGASFLFRPACFHAFLPIPVLGLLQFLSPVAGSLHSSCPSASAFPFRFPAAPLSFRLRFGYSAFKCILTDSFHSLRNCRSVANTSILAYNLAYVNYFFQIFSIFFLNAENSEFKEKKRSEIKRFQTAQDQYSIIPTRWFR